MKKLLQLNKPDPSPHTLEYSFDYNSFMKCLKIKD